MAKKSFSAIRGERVHENGHFNEEQAARAWWGAYNVVGASNCSAFLGLKTGIFRGFLGFSKKIPRG